MGSNMFQAINPTVAMESNMFIMISAKTDFQCIINIYIRIRSDLNETYIGPP